MSRIGLQGIIVFVLATLVGCVSGVGKDNRNKIRNGMSPPDVEKILGGPGTELSESELESFVKQPEAPPDSPPLPKVDTRNMKGYKWGSEKKYIIVIFRHDRVFEVYDKGL